jgi:four helix bundle protein
MEKVYSFEKLKVWEEARTFVKWIYDTTDSYPSSERFGLSGQLRRASISVVSNLAEGSARKSPKDQAHFFQIAYSSLIEVLNQLIVSADLGFLTEAKLKEGRMAIEQLTPRVSSLRNTCLNRN